MNKYQSHKIVEAARVIAFDLDKDGDYQVIYEDGATERLEGITGDRILKMAALAGTEVVGGWVMHYPDLYISWSPHSQFDDGYDLVQPSSGKSKIAGYRELTETEINNMNAVKEHGRKLGDLVDGMREQIYLDGKPQLDQRWVALGATHLQQGLMCLTRAIAKPEFF